jgi:hypothetical protein
MPLPLWENLLAYVGEEIEWTLAVLHIVMNRKASVPYQE